MSEPYHYVKDSQLFTVAIEDFESLMDGEYHTRELGLAGGHKWLLIFIVSLRPPYVTLNILHRDNSPQAKSVSINFATYFTKHPDTKVLFLSEGDDDFKHEYYFEVDGNVVPLDILLNDDYLVSGALTIHVEIRVNSITDEDGVRRFNYHDPFKGCVKLWNPNWDRDFFVGKQMISHHCPVLAILMKQREKEGKDANEIEVPTKNATVQFEVFLQLLHGVPMKMNFQTFYNVVRTAHRFRVKNLFHHPSDELEQWNFSYYWSPMKRLKYLIAKTDNEKALGEFLKKECDLEMMKTELLKAIVRKFFSFAVNFNKYS